MTRKTVFVFFLALSVLALAGFASAQDKKPAFNFDKLRITLDANNDGILSPEEIKPFAEALQKLLDKPHKAVTELDKIFDGNKNGQVELAEIQYARKVFFEHALVRAYERGADFIAGLLPKPPAKPDPALFKDILDFLFDAPALGKPHKVKTQVDKFIDTNKNGTVEEPEIKTGRELLLKIAVASAVLPPAIPKSGIKQGPVATALDEFIDTNHDGQIDEVEARQAQDTFSSIHPVKSPLDTAIDFNSNGNVEDFEIAKALRAATIPAKNSAETSFPITTKIDALFDLNGDKKVSSKEIGVIAGILASDSFVLQGNEPIAKFIDLDSDKTVTRKEIIRFLDSYLRPHPSNPKNPLDKELDKNKNGFVEPDEIGIAAGFSPAGPVTPIDAQIAYMISMSGAKPIKPPSPAGPAEAPANPTGPTSKSGATGSSATSGSTGATSATGSASASATSSGGTTSSQATQATEASTVLPRATIDLSGKKCALSEVSDQSKSIDADDLAGISLFIQNAFVNIGKAKIVEHGDLDKVFAEVELQLSLGSDTAANVLKEISGVDVLVIGSLMKVGSAYYLSLKLVSVANGEVLGSSVADASSADGFYDMCVEAVTMLF